MASSGAVPYRTYSTSDFVKRFTNVAQSSMFRAVFNIQNLPFTSSFSPSNRYTEDLSILCSEASLPGSRFSTSENNQDYYGISQKFAYRKDFDTIDLTFYVDTGYKTLKDFIDLDIHQNIKQPFTFTSLIKIMNLFMLSRMVVE
jgi:hypothetical protein